MKYYGVALVWLLVIAGSAGVAQAQSSQIVGANCLVVWNANQEPDLASYRVYGTLTPAGGTAVSKTVDVLKPGTSTTCAALGLQTGGILSVQLDAVDQVGNRSAKTVPVVVTQDVQGPTQPTGLTVTPSP